MATLEQQRAAQIRRQMAADALGITLDQYIAGIRDGTYGAPGEYINPSREEQHLLNSGIGTNQINNAYDAVADYDPNVQLPPPGTPYDELTQEQKIAVERASGDDAFRGTGSISGSLDAMYPRLQAPVDEYTEFDATADWVDTGGTLGLADVQRMGHLYGGDGLRALVEGGKFSAITPKAFERLYPGESYEDFQITYNPNYDSDNAVPNDGLTFEDIYNERYGDQDWWTPGGGGTGGGGTGGGGTGGGQTGGGGAGGGTGSGGGGTGGGGTGGGGTGNGGGGAGGGGGSGAGGGYQWNWDYFGTPTDTGTGTTVTDLIGPPGEDASWGQEGFPGNNQDFYSDQFQRLLTQQNRYRLADQQARDARANAPQQQGDLSWGWLEGGLPEVQVAGAPDWSANFQSGQTNQQLLEGARGDLSPSAYQFHLDRFGRQPGVAEGSYYSTWESPDEYMSYVGEMDPIPRSYHQQFADALWTDQNAGNPAPTGYASPNPQFSWNTGDSFGYDSQQAPSYFFNPSGGSWTPTNLNF